MFERFTDRARHAVVLAQDEARALNHAYIGTEHLLLGLLRVPEGIAARALRRLGIGADAVRRDVESIIGRGQASPPGHIPFTPRSKKVLELSLREALGLGHNYIGTEHILLGLVREGEGVAAQVLVKRGAQLARVREVVLEEISRYGAERTPPRGRPRFTPAAEQVVEAAEGLAGDGPTGSHHLLQALAGTEGSLAAKVLAALGVDADAIAARVDELGLEGTTDISPEEMAARQVEVRLDGAEVHVVLRDEASLETAKAITDRLGGGPVRGDDPEAASLVGLWQAVLSGLEELRRQVTPVAEPEDKSRLASAQRAIEARLRRRGQPKER
jgi:ATP-dependent Clp protease ATP-binding subunit ClpC